MLPIYPYMKGLRDEEPYSAATGFAYSLKRFSSLAPDEIAENSGSTYDPGASTPTIVSLGRAISVQHPRGDVFFADSRLRPVWDWCFILLNYLGRADNTPLTGELISYRETDQGQVFYSAFYKSTIFPLVERLAGEDAKRIEKIKRACADLGAVVWGTNYITAVFSLFPRFPVTVKIWPKDEELPGSANILFDSSANHYLHTEDIAGVGGLVSRFLISQFENY